MAPIKKTANSSDGNVFAGLIYLVSILGIVGIILSIVFYLIRKDDPLVKYHFKQWLVLLIFGIIGSIISAILILVLVGFVLLAIVAVVCLVLWIIGMINGFSGKMQPLPIIGKYAEKFKF